MLHPDTELRFINEQIGYGVVATRPIPKGTITWVMDHLDRVFTPEDVSTMGDPYRQIIDRYTFRDNRGNYILCWDHARYINHSFHANCISTAYDFELAVRDIDVGEELTDDYGYLNIDEPFEALPEKGTRRRFVMPDDLLRYHRQWDRKLEQAFARLGGVPQPLAAVMPEATLAKARDIAAGRVRMDSILTCYWARGENGKAVADLPAGRLPHAM